MPPEPVNPVSLRSEQRNTHFWTLFSLEFVSQMTKAVSESLYFTLLTFAKVESVTVDIVFKPAK